MIDNFQYPKGTVLSPPITYDDNVYSYGFLFNPIPSNNNDGYEIVTGKIHSVVDLGSNTYKIICERDYQYSSYTKDKVEITTQHSCGGNISPSQEWQRVLSYNNPMSLSGSLESIRAIPGDGCKISRAGKDYLWEITSSTAYSEAPDIVNYSGDTPQQTIGFINCDINNIFITQEITDNYDSYIEGTEIVFNTDWDQQTYVSSLYIDDDGYFSLSEKLTELPADFGNGLSGNKYYYDGSYHFRLITDATSYGDTYVLQWMLKDANYLLNHAPDNYQVIQTDTASEFLTVGDKCLISGKEIFGDFDLNYTVYHKGCLQFRIGTGHTLPSMMFAFDENGDLYCQKRSSTGWAYTSISVTQSDSYDYPFQVRIKRDDNVISFYSRQSSAFSWESNCASSLTFGVGIVGLSPIDVDLGFFNNQEQNLFLYKIGASNGTTYLARQKSGPITYFEEYTKPAAESIVEVFNETSNTVMSSGGGDRRDRYVLSGDKIILRTECDGDRIRIICSAPADVFPPPGNAPRNFSQPYMSEYQGDIDNPQLASEDVANNRFNWRDSITIKVESNDFVPIAGEFFTIIRGRGVWSTDSSVNIYIDYKNDTETDWNLLNPTNYYLRKYQGLLLIKKSFMDTLSKDFCIKIEGKRYRSGADKDVFNELKSATEMLDELYFETNITGNHEVTSPSGITSGMTVLPANFSCNTDLNLWVPNKVAYGTMAETVRDYIYTHGSLPHWETFGDGSRVSLRKGTNIVDSTNTPMACGDPAHYIGEYDYVIDDEEFLWIAPYSNEIDSIFRGHWTRENFEITGYTGDPTIPIVISDEGPANDNYVLGYVGLAGSFICNHISSGFKFSAIPVVIPEEIKRMPNGITILDAKLRVKFDGMRQRTLSGNYTISPDGLDYRWEYYEQGVLALMYERFYVEEVGFVEDSYDNYGYWAEPTKGGSIGFQLIGQRKNTTDMITWDNQTVYQPAGTLHSIGGTISSNVDDGKWGIIDATGLAKALYKARTMEYSNFWLYPSNAQLDSEDDVSEMASYLESLCPSHSASINVNNDTGQYGYSCQAAGKVTWWSSLEIGSIHIKYRLSSGIINDMVLPFVQPKFI
jgi:hypothetical protein